MTTPTRSDEFSIEDVRDILNNPNAVYHKHVGFQLQALRTRVLAEASDITDRTAGRERLASEERSYRRAMDDVQAVDDALVIATRQADAFSAAAAKHGDQMYGMANDKAPASKFGDQIRTAIGEVLEGRAQAFVDAPAERVLTESGAAGQGVPIQFMEPVSTLRAKSIVMRLPGLRTVPMTSDRARWPRIGSATASGTAEAATLTAANTQTDSVDVVAQKFSSYEELSSELVEDYTVDALSIFGQNLLNQLGLRVDLGLLEGNGASDCVGMRNTIGANSTSVAGTPSNFAKFRTAEYELRLDNGEPVVWVMHPRTWKTLGDVKTGIASDETTLLEPDPQQGPRTLLGFPVEFSTQITLTEGTNGSWAALLDTSQLLVAERRPARLEFSRDFKFDEDKIAARATWRGNLVALNPEAISLLTDIRA